MTNIIGLKGEDREAFRTTAQDGLWDIFLGILLIGIGFSIFYKDFIENPVAFLIGPTTFLVGFITFFLGKKYISIPRLDSIKAAFGPVVDVKEEITVFEILGLILLVIVLMTVMDTITFVGLEIFIAIIPLSIIAYFIDINRLYLVAVLFAIRWPLSEIVFQYRNSPIDDLIVFGGTGAILFISGCVLLFRFIRRYSKSA